MSKQTQTLVIGAGPGGYAAAFLAADLGQKVIMVDPLDNPGGVCLHWGCIPTKALLHVTKVMGEAEEAKNWGVTFSEPKVDVDGVRAFKDKVVKQLVGGTSQLAKQRKVEHMKGHARFTDANTAEVALNDGKTETVSFENAIVATGATSAKLPTVNIESNRVLYAKSALELENIPKTLLVIGGGYIGVELGTVFSKFGSEVSVVEMLPDIMATSDADLRKVWEKGNKKTFKEVLTNTKVSSAKETKNGIEVTFEGANGKGTSKTETYEKVLVSVGNTPNSKDVGLEAAGVKTDERGYIPVDEQRRTNVDHIYAIGDITGQPLLAHKASHEGRVAAEAIAGEKTAYEPATVPAVVYTDPEIAWCGLTEREASEQGVEYELASFPWAASGRAIAMGTSNGLTKLLVDPKTERILGVGIAGKEAGELISEGVLAVEMAAQAKDLSLSIHPHPTLSETVMEAAEAFYGLSTHIYRPRKKA
ncbi:MAG: dihydrolipoyl dehydrogenase [Spirochaetes bacterium]|jgi:dihydrolipoamide dehydrogenase|nr:dihydrolipoyl dehydrogenase [Spirochaetota bacterium]